MLGGLAQGFIHSALNFGALIVSGVLALKWYGMAAGFISGYIDLPPSMLNLAAMFVIFVALFAILVALVRIVEKPLTVAATALPPFGVLNAIGGGILV